MPAPRPRELRSPRAIPSHIAAAVIRRDKQCACGNTTRLSVHRKGAKDYEVRCPSCHPSARSTSAVEPTRSKPAGPTRKQLVHARRLALEVFDDYAHRFGNEHGSTRGARSGAILRARKRYDDADRALAVANAKAGLATDTDRSDKPKYHIAHRLDA